MERRDFLTGIAATALVTAATRWLNTTPALPESATGRNVTTPVVEALHARLDALRHLDDRLGSGRLRPLADTELRLVTDLLTDRTHSETVRRGLYSAASEAGRICGWLAFDSGDQHAARRHYLAALRAADSAEDVVARAHASSFAAIQAYSTGRPQDAVTMLEAAQAGTRGRATPRMLAMLHIRQARAHAKAGERPAAIRSINAAFDAWARGPRDDDPAYLYWVTEAELLSLAGSTALDLGDAPQALAYFRKALRTGSLDGAGSPRDACIYYARLADAHLATGQIDDACDAAHSALRCMGGVDSARGTGILDDCRTKLATHKDVPAVRDFLDLTT